MLQYGILITNPGLNLISLFLIRTSTAVCFFELGCFPTTYPWTSALRPFPEPTQPHDINTNILLYTRKNRRTPYNVQLWPAISLENSPFQRNVPYNVFIIHGYMNNGNIPGMQRIKNGYLNRRDANVFVVDWRDAANTLNYLQAASDTRVVGAELARFGRFLKNQYDVSPSTIHVIGHSLGAQTASYFAKRLPGIGRITALDPAQPGFEHCDEKVRLTSSDATFVETLHTNIRPFILLGFGMIEPVAHLDIYANGGLIQPGCPFEERTLPNITALNVVDLISTVGCSHLRAITYLIEALENNDCVFWAHPMKNVKQQPPIGIGVTLTLAQLFSNMPKCTAQTCVPFSLENVNYKARGVYLLPTNSNPPYCKKDSRRK